MLDSGATHNLLPTSMIPILISKGVRIHYGDKVALLADGKAAKIVGCGIIPVNVEKNVYVGEFCFIEGLPYEAILGMPCLKGLKLCIDFGKQEIACNNGHGKNFIPSIELAAFSCPELNDHTENTNHVSQDFERFINSWKQKFLESPGRTDLAKHHIYLEKDTPPIKQRPYYLSKVKQDQIREEVKKLIEKGYIEESSSPWSSNVVLVPKKTGETRLCIDFRKLNAVTKKNAYPVPHLVQILDSLKNGNYISTIDLLKGYHQIAMGETSKEFTAFTVPGMGLYHWNVLPFGLTGAPATFQHLMDKVLREVLGENVFVYLDDIIVIGQTVDEHNQILAKVFSLLFVAGLQINWDKSRFLKEETEYLGHIVGGGKIRTSPKKTDAISSFPAPTNVKQLRSFLGLCAWYRRFIPNHSTVMEPLTRLLHKDCQWEWGKDQQVAFADLKEILVSPPILHCPDHNLPFIIQSDASNVGCGSVLIQEVDGIERVIAFASRTFSKAERDYGVTERECLGVLEAVRHFRPYVEGTRFTLITDHSSLKWLINMKNASGRLARWCVELSQYDFDLVHRKGKFMVVSDALSRAPYNEMEEVEPISVLAFETLNFDFTTVKDKWFLNLKDNLEKNSLDYPNFCLKDNLIYKRVKSPSESWKLLIPQDFRIELLREAHDAKCSAHQGFRRTLKKLQNNYYWPKMSSDVKQYVRKCRDCQKYKADNKLEAGHMNDHISELKPMSILSMDLIGPLVLSKQRNRFALTIVDTATKWVFAFPLKSATAACVQKAFVEHVLLIHGIPEILLTDNGTCFTAKLFEEMCQRYNIRHHLTPKYSPRNNAVERSNRTIKTAVAMLSKDQREWDDNLKFVTFSLNTSVCESTGYTPAMLVFGRELRQPFDIISNVVHGDAIEFNPDTYRDTIQEDLARVYDRALHIAQKSKTNQAGIYNLRHRKVSYDVGNLVWLRNFDKSNKADFIAAKLSEKFKGPFKIGKVLSSNQYEVLTLSGRSLGRWPVHHMKPVI